MGRNSTTETLAAVAASAVVLGSTALFGLYMSRRSQKATRRATLQCKCGKVKAEIHQPAANYKYAETTNLQCLCKDCVGYCKTVLKVGSTDDAFQKSFFDPGIPTVLFYDSEIKLVEGRDQLEHIKLSKGTENRRVFARCCGTPLAICPDRSHLNLVYCPVVKPLDTKACVVEHEIPFPQTVLDQPTILLYAKWLGNDAAKEAIKTKHPNMKIIPDHFAPVSMLGIVGRLVLLIGMGVRGPGKGFPVEADKKVGIGYEAIAKQMK